MARKPTIKTPHPTPNYYQVLQVDPHASSEAIEAAYRRLARQYHPDLNKSPDATRQMMALNEAYEVLGSDVRREEYDRTVWSVLEAEQRKQRVSINGEEMRLSLSAAVEMQLVRIPAGKFAMGSADGHVNQQPIHRVHLDEYWIGKYPVTVEAYAAFIASQPYQTLAERQGSGWINIKEQVAGASWRHPQGPKSDLTGKENHPVTLIAWEDALAFCQWASSYTGVTVRLPSEAEWEKAARGPDGRRWPWGNQAPFPGQDRGRFWKKRPPETPRGNFRPDLHAPHPLCDTSPVGKFSPQGDSPYRCADMAGNVWEWVADWYAEGYYSLSPSENPAGPESGETRVRRGGAWYLGPEGVTTTNRGFGALDYYPFTGFRVAVSLALQFP